MILRMYKMDFNESVPASHISCLSCSSSGPVCLHMRAVSQEDKRFLTMMENETRFVDGHYQHPLPFRDSNFSMPNNRNQVLQRANGIRKRFAANSKFHADYTKFMNDIINKGYAKKVTDSERHAAAQRGDSWYIPHHGVYHPCKPGKIRVLFDADFVQGHITQQHIVARVRFDELFNRCADSIQTGTSGDNGGH
jgi:hypothetical protein